MSEQRPVPLEQHVLVQADDHTEPELIDLYRRDANGEQTVKLNAQLINRLDQLDRQAERRKGERRPDKRRAKGKGGRWDDRPHKVERHTPRRWAVVDELNFLDMLPGIYFIFQETVAIKRLTSASTQAWNSPPATKCNKSDGSSMRWSKAS